MDEEDTFDAWCHQRELEERWWTEYHIALCEQQKAEKQSFAETEKKVWEWIDAR